MKPTGHKRLDEGVRREREGRGEEWCNTLTCLKIFLTYYKDRNIWKLDVALTDNAAKDFMNKNEDLHKNKVSGVPAFLNLSEFFFFSVTDPGK